MRLSMRKNSDGGTIGLDIDGRFLAAVQMRDGQVTRAASMELPPGAMHDGEVADRAALSAALKEFVASAGLPHHVRLGISNQQIVVRVIELPRIEDPSERDTALRFQAAEAIAMPLDEAVLDHQVAGYVPEPGGGERMQVVVVAARRTMVEEFAAAAKDAGLKTESLDLDAFALVRTLADETPGDDSARVFCHLGGMSNLAIAVGRSCFFTRALSPASEDEGAAARLADEIRLSIDYYRTQPNSQQVSEIMLSGPGSHDASLAEAVQAQLGTPVVVAAPLGVIEASGLPDGEDPSRFTVAAGLALGADA